MRLNKRNQRMRNSNLCLESNINLFQSKRNLKIWNIKSAQKWERIRHRKLKLQYLPHIWLWFRIEHQSFRMARNYQFRDSRHTIQRRESSQPEVEWSHQPVTERSRIFHPTSVNHSPPETLNAHRKRAIRCGKNTIHRWQK